MSVRTELDSLHAGLFLIRQELVELQRESGIDREEVYKRLVWYSHLERLAVVVNEFLANKAGEDDLREMADQVGKVHRFVSPAVRPADAEQKAASEIGLVPLSRPA